MYKSRLKISKFLRGNHCGRSFCAQEIILSSSYRPLTTLFRAHTEGTKSEWDGRVSFMCRYQKQKKNYLGRAPLSAYVRVCNEHKDSHEPRRRYRSLGRKPERERRRKQERGGEKETSMSVRRGSCDRRASSWGLMNDGRSTTTALKLSR